MWSSRKRLSVRAQRALLSATQDLTVCCLASLGRLRESGDPLARLLADNRHLRIEIAELQSALAVRRSTRESVPPRRRRHYAPAERFKIVEHMRKFLLTVEQTARRFLVTQQTLYNWLAELREEPGKTTIGSLLQPVPPVRRYADVVRRLTRQMKDFHFGGSRQIAATLAQSIGWKPDRRSVGRFCKEKLAPVPPTDPSPPMTTEKRPTTVRGRYPNHLWLADITRIPLLFPFLYLHLAVVLDAYSRMPFAARVFLFEPSAKAVLALVLQAIARHGKPRHFVSDQGDQFTADLFRAALKAMGIRQRFGALYKHGSIALIERFWRSLKEDLHLGKKSSRSKRPWSLVDFERRLGPALVRYSYCRPHSAIDGRAPAEVYFGRGRGHGLAAESPLLLGLERGVAPRGRGFAVLVRRGRAPKAIADAGVIAVRQVVAHEAIPRVVREVRPLRRLVRVIGRGGSRDSASRVERLVHDDADARRRSLLGRPVRSPQAVEGARHEVVARPVFRRRRRRLHLDALAVRVAEVEV